MSSIFHLVKLTQSQTPESNDATAVNEAVKRLHAMVRQNEFLPKSAHMLLFLYQPKFSRSCQLLPPIIFDVISAINLERSKYFLKLSFTAGPKPNTFFAMFVIECPARIYPPPIGRKVERKSRTLKGQEK